MHLALISIPIIAILSFIAVEMDKEEQHPIIQKEHPKVEVELDKLLQNCNEFAEFEEND